MVGCNNQLSIPDRALLSFAPCPLLQCKQLFNPRRRDLKATCVVGLLLGKRKNKRSTLCEISQCKRRGEMMKKPLCMQNLFRISLNLGFVATLDHSHQFLWLQWNVDIDNWSNTIVSVSYRLWLYLWKAIIYHFVWSIICSKLQGSLGSDLLGKEWPNFLFFNTIFEVLYT